MSLMLANSADPDEIKHYGSLLFANVPLKGYPIYSLTYIVTLGN